MSLGHTALLSALAFWRYDGSDVANCKIKEPWAWMVTRDVRDDPLRAVTYFELCRQARDSLIPELRD